MELLKQEESPSSEEEAFDLWLLQSTSSSWVKEECQDLAMVKEEVEEDPDEGEIQASEASETEKDGVDEQAEDALAKRNPNGGDGQDEDSHEDNVGQEEKERMEVKREEEAFNWWLLRSTISRMEVKDEVRVKKEEEESDEDVCLEVDPI